MFKTEKIEELVKYSLLTGYLKDDYSVPTSLMLIAPPKDGKTTIINEIECKDVLSTMDLSSKPIKDKIIPLLAKGKLHHLLITDMVKMLSHKPETCASVVAFLNALMEEGVKDNLFFGQTFNLKNRVYCGIITSITPPFFYKEFRKWYDKGS